MFQGIYKRTVTTSFTLSNADNGYVIVVDNGATPVIITVPAGLNKLDFFS
jgi:hypothetical protein